MADMSTLKMFAVAKPDGSSDQFSNVEGYRVDKHGTLTLWGKRYATVAAYPAGRWSYVSEAAPTV